MDKQFDELSKSLAEGVSRREALRKFGIGLAGMLLATVGLNTKSTAGSGYKCWTCGQVDVYYCSAQKPGPGCNTAHCRNCPGCPC